MVLEQDVHKGDPYIYIYIYTYVRTRLTFFSSYYNLLHRVYFNIIEIIHLDMENLERKQKKLIKSKKDYLDNFFISKKSHI